MNVEIIQQKQDLSISKKDNELFARFCKDISKKVEQRRPIYEKTILDFSLLTTRIFQFGSFFELPNCFKQLSEHIEDYWLYSAFDDEDKELSFSYIRLYQIVYMYKVSSASNKLEKKLLEASTKYKNHFNLFFQIREKPGITHKDLAEKINKSIANLSHQTSELEEQGFITSYRHGKYKHYQLSYSGLKLYDRLVDEIGYDIVALWSKRRLKVFYHICDQLSDDYEKKDRVVNVSEIQIIIKELSKRSESEIEKVYDKIRKEKREEEDNSISRFEDIDQQRNQLPFYMQMDKSLQAGYDFNYQNEQNEKSVTNLAKLGMAVCR